MSRISKLSKEELEKICKESTSFSDIARKVGYPSYQSGSAITITRKYIESLGIDTSHFNGQAWNKNNFDYSRFQKGKHIQGNNAKDALINLRGRKCEVCGNTEWLGEEIPLVIHHIDGDHMNNELSNLQLLCPNCHAQTDNYCGKNIKGKRQKYTEEQFVQALKATSNVNQALKQIGIHYSAKCYYEEAYRLIEKYNIDQSVNKNKAPKQSDIKIISVDGEEHKLSECAKILNLPDRSFRKYIEKYGEENVKELIRRFKKNPEKLNCEYESLYLLYMEDKINSCSKRGTKYKSVAKIDMNTKEIVSEYESLLLAAESVGRKDTSHISEVCNGKEHSAYGFFWKYIL